MQIDRVLEFDKDVADLLSLCVADGQRELREYLQNDAVFVYTAKTNGKTVGIICILKTPDTVDLLDIAVHPDLRRQGIGRALCDAVLCKQTLLEVRASNTDAIEFYKKLGFEQISVRKNYYSAPTEDALIFRREL